MKYIVSLLALVLPLTGLTQDSKEKTQQEGRWHPLTATLGDNPLPAEILKIMTLRMEGNNYTVKIGNQIDKGTWKLLPKTKPQAMDITGTIGPNKGKTIPSIVEVKDDNMKICYGLAGQRPKEFKTTGQPGLYLVVYKRQKK